VPAAPEIEESAAGHGSEGLVQRGQPVWSMTVRVSSVIYQSGLAHPHSGVAHMRSPAVTVTAAAMPTTVSAACLLMTLEELRKMLRVDQRDLAEALGLSATSVHKAERSTDPQFSTVNEFVGGLRKLGHDVELEMRVRINGRRQQLEFPQRSGSSSWSGANASDADYEKQSDEGLAGAVVFRRKEEARRALTALVAQGAKEGRHSIPVDHLGLLGEWFTAWARAFGRPAPGGTWFGGRSHEPGLWHALQGLVPIENTNWWNDLRKAVVAHLIDTEQWHRLGGSLRGSEFFVGD
jgi:hypothetical protein